MTAEMCLAIGMFFEARGEGPDGMRAVGEVIVNRVENDRFPDDPCSVIFDGCTFSFNCDGLPENIYMFDEPGDSRARRMALELSKEILASDNELLSEDVTHYHTIHVSPSWSRHPDFNKEGRVGTHVFYSCENYC